MANTKSALKRIRTSARRHQRNQAAKSEARTFVKRGRNALTADPQNALQEIRLAVSALDRAVRKGVLHGNNAARRKSRLMKAYNKAVAAAAAPAVEEKPTRRRAATSRAKPTGSTRTTRAKAAKSETDEPKKTTRTRKPKAE